MPAVPHYKRLNEKRISSQAHTIPDVQDVWSCEIKRRCYQSRYDVMHSHTLHRGLQKAQESWLCNHLALPHNHEVDRSVLLLPATTWLTIYR